MAARTLWQEARNETLLGQQAVSWVIKNRLKSGRWGKSLASVCLWRAQFSGWYVPTDPNFEAVCELPDDDAKLQELRGVLQDVLGSETDPTHGATLYHAESIPPPAWVKGDPGWNIKPAIFCGKFGTQLFYKGIA